MPADNAVMSAHGGIEWLIKHDFVPATGIHRELPAPWYRYIAGVEILVHYEPWIPYSFIRSNKVWSVSFCRKRCDATNIEEALKETMKACIPCMDSGFGPPYRSQLMVVRDAFDCLKDIDIPEICEKKQKTSSSGAKKRKASKSK